MKKCPECGNPSYDGAPVCGNCGYAFPKTKSAHPKREDIFQQAPKKKKSSKDDNTLNIIKKNSLTIGVILIITVIVICGIILIGSNESSLNGELVKYSEAGFSFNYPKNWQSLNASDEDHIGAIFFKNENNVTIEFYNDTSDFTSLRDISQSIINYAQENGAYIEFVETVTLDGRNSSDIIIQQADGEYTRFVSMFDKGNLYAFRITGNNTNSLSTGDINTTISSVNIA